MTRTGPQRYPGADQTRRYQATYPGDAMDVNVVVLHTTEGRTLPDYGGGALAPNLTAVPDFTNQRLRWYQHFDIDTSSRALRNLAGGVETNTLNVCQVELVGTCDPGTHSKWGDTAHIYWPQAPDWALAELAVFLRWMHDQHGVPLSGPSLWPAYPASYGAGSGQRMTGAAWTAFTGICGHMHVPENDHGDPGAIDFTKLIALTKGSTIEEDPMAGITKADIYDAVWKTDAVTAPPDAPDAATNPAWQAQSYLKDTNARVRGLEKTSTAQAATISELVKTVATLAAGIGGLDPAAIVADLKAAIEAIDIHIDATP